MMTVNKEILCVIWALLFVVAIALVGCDRKETILDIETPNGELEVQRDIDSGDVSVEVDDHY